MAIATFSSMAQRGGRPTLTDEQAERVRLELEHIYEGGKKSKAHCGRLLGMSAQAFEALRTGVNKPSLKTVEKIAAVRRMSVVNLLGLSVATPTMPSSSASPSEEAVETMGRMLRLQQEHALPTLESLLIADERRRSGRRWSNEVAFAARSGFFGFQDLHTEEWEERLDELQRFMDKWREQERHRSAKVLGPADRHLR